jgi:predicted amidohydrolase
MKKVTLALAQYAIERLATFEDFSRKLHRLAGEAKAAGAELLVLPEYASMEVASAFVPAPDIHAELDAVVSRSGALLAAMRDAAMAHGIWLLPGSLPVRAAGGVEGRVLNRAPLIAPDGRVAFQDKHVMTRFEAESWGVAPGAPPSVFDAPWGRTGIAICYDSEFPMLVRAQVAAGAWLILVPTCTDTLHGFNRVFVSARARALENQCYVAVAPTVGAAPWSGTLDENRGFAALLGPIDRGFPEDGILARGTPDAAELVIAEADPARLAAVRQEGAVRNWRDWPETVPPAPLAVPA